MNPSNSNIHMAMSVAIMCNNSGIDMLRAGRRQAAIKVLKGASALLHPIFESFKKIETNGQDPKDALLSYMSSSSSLSSSTCSSSQSEIELVSRIIKERSQRALQTLQSLTKNHDDEDDDDDVCCQHIPKKRKRCYSQDDLLMNCTGPMRISFSCMYESKLSCFLISSIIIFNIAMAFQQSKKTEMYLQKSARMLDLAYALASSGFSSIIEESNNNNDDDDVSKKMVLKSQLKKVCMASLNNAGLTYHSLGNYTFAKRNLDTLFEYIANLHPSSSSVSIVNTNSAKTRSSSSLSSSELEKEERQEFLMNIWLVRRPDLAAAA